MREPHLQQQISIYQQNNVTKGLVNTLYAEINNCRDNDKQILYTRMPECKVYWIYSGKSDLNALNSSFKFEYVTEAKPILFDDT